MTPFPRQGQGIETPVDASDTGYTVNDVPVDYLINAKKMEGLLSGASKGLQEVLMKGYPNGCRNWPARRVRGATLQAEATP